MIQLSFDTEKEVVSFYKYFSTKKNKCFELILDANSVGIIPQQESFNAEDRQYLIYLFTNYIQKKYEKTWLLDFIIKSFHFENEHEQTDILDIAQSILDGEKEDIPQVSSLPSRESILRQALGDIVKNSTILEFDSISTFRLNIYKKYLLRVVEFAIDEYKLQQEYESFVDKLRVIVKKYRPLHKTIYVIDDKPFVLFDEKFQELNHFQSIRSFYPLLRQWGIEAEPSILVSLMGLAPEAIHIYTNRSDEGVMRTIQNVFEERVSFHPLITTSTLKNLDL